MKWHETEKRDLPPLSLKDKELIAIVEGELAIVRMEEFNERGNIGLRWKILYPQIYKDDIQPTHWSDVEMP